MMNDDQESPTDEPESSAEPTSLFGRLFNVFAAPGELFEEIRRSKPSHSNWVVPLILSICAGVLFSVVVFSQPDIVASVFEQQEAVVMAKVDAGNISQEQADKSIEAMRQFQSGKLLMIFGSLGAGFGTIIFFVILSLLIWLLTSKILKGGIPLVKAFELVGLAGMINVLGALVTMLIVLLKGSILAGPNAAILLGSFDQASYLHQFLSALGVMTIWYLVVLSIGASKLSGRTIGVAAIWIFGVWAVVRFGMAIGSAWWAQFQAKM